MKNFLALIEQKMMRPLATISRQRHLRAIREGVMAALPLTLIGSLFMFLAVVPLPESWAIKQFLDRHSTLILMPYRMTMSVLTLYIVVGIGYSLAKYYKYNPLSGSVIALVAFLMTILPVNAVSLIPEAFLAQASAAGLETNWVESIQELGWVIPEASLSNASSLVGALAAIFGVEVMHLCRNFKIPLKQFSQLPPAIMRTIQSIVPVSVVVLVLFFVRGVLSFDIQGFIQYIFEHMVHITGTLPGALVLVLLVALLWLLGIQGFTVVGSVASPVWVNLMQANLLARANGQPLPNIAPLPFYQWFVWIGGSGATLALVILLCFSKSGYLKRLGFTCMLPSLCNINDPVIYGVPVMLNPYMTIPFLLGPAVTTVISYAAMSINLVNKPYAAPLTALPAPIGAFMATGDWRAIVLCLFNIGVCILIYYPFVKLYEQRLIEEGEVHAMEQELKEDPAAHVTSVK